MSYAAVAEFAQTWGLLFLILLFVAAVAYAFWPGNRRKFERAARLPLEDADNEGPARPHDRAKDAKE